MSKKQILEIVRLRQAMSEALGCHTLWVCHETLRKALDQGQLQTQPLPVCPVCACYPCRCNEGLGTPGVPGM